MRYARGLSKLIAVKHKRITLETQPLPTQPPKHSSPHIASPDWYKVTAEMHTHIKRRDGMRPTTTVRSEPRRVYATHHTAETLRLEQGVAAYRSAYLIIQGFGRLQRRSLSLSPLFLHYAQRIVGLLCPLTITLLVLVLLQCVVRRHPTHQGATRKGIYLGQLGRQTTRPDAVVRHSQRLYFHSRDTTL